VRPLPLRRKLARPVLVWILTTTSFVFTRSIGPGADWLAKNV
jgi:hypothetical protein